MCSSSVVFILFFHTSWIRLSNSTLSISSFYAALSSYPSVSSFIQNHLVSPFSCQSQLFHWKIASNGGLTLKMIQSFYPHITTLPNSCPLCLSAANTNAHLYLHCPFSWRLWGNLLQLVNCSFESKPQWLTSCHLEAYSNPARPRGNCGSGVCMPSYGQLGRSAIVCL